MRLDANTPSNPISRLVHLTLGQTFVRLLRRTYTEQITSPRDLLHIEFCCNWTDTPRRTRQVISRTAQPVWSNMAYLYGDHYCSFASHCSIETRDNSGVSNNKADHACSHPRVPRAHQAGLSRRSLAGFGLSESL
ncbi:hypothetical protein TNCV_2758801 [Trichonephila clavipes]|nr:hypothetical protein TNCV_2758801 [Trichonephila clavipes]